MAVTFAVGLRTCCVGLALFLATARAGEPASPLIGATRDQVLTRYGEPKSQMAVGNRLIFFYPRERVVLRDNVVVEVEEIAADPSVAAPAPPPTTPSADGTTAPGSTATAPAPPATEPKLEIKLVRPPSKDARPAVSEPKSPPVAAPPPVASPPVVVPQTVPPATSVPAESAPAVPNVTEAPVAEALPPAPADEPAVEKKSADAPAAGNKKTDAKQADRKTAADEAAPIPEPGISNRTYGVMALVLLVGAGVLFWRRRQRQLELAASSVENTPLETAAVPVITGNGFTAEVLNKLDQRQFEDLVAAYYNKTGVVADRTHSVPEGAVQLKISWKGEPRPFAYVQCLAHPSGAIDPKPLQSLIAALEADDIRRGYVVTTGRFTTPARELAVEKHLTLLPGEVFLEKLNALPTAARTEIMRSIGAGSSGAER